MAKNIGDNFLKIYNENNKLASKNSSFIERVIFAPIAHQKANDPTTIESENELPYFACTMQDGRGKNTINKRLQGLSEDEFQIFKLIVSETAKLTENWGLKTAPKDSLITHLYQYRQVKKKFPNAKNILEIGPGSGYLSLILALKNCNVFAYDVYQAIYVYQHYLYKHFGVLNELATNLPNINDINGIDLNSGVVNHLPWWIFDNLIDNPLPIDLILINNAVCELHPVALDHILAIARACNVPNFFLDSTGDQSLIRKLPEVIKQFKSSGFVLSNNSVKHQELFIFDRSNNSSINSKYNNFKKVIFIFSQYIFKFVPFLNPLLAFISQEIYRINKNLRAIFRISILFKKKSLSRYYYEDVLKIYDKVFKNNDFSTPNEKFLKRIS